MRSLEVWEHLGAHALRCLSLLNNSFSEKNIFPWEHGNITLLVKIYIFMGTWQHNSFSEKNIFPWEHRNITLLVKNIFSWEHGNTTLLVKKTYFHGNMGTYKIGELPLA